MTLTVDRKNYLVFIDGQKVMLSPTEWKLFILLFDNRGQVISRQQLLRQVWRASYVPGVVSVYVNYLRRKLGADLIVTRYGYGYLMKGEDDSN